MIIRLPNRSCPSKFTSQCFIIVSIVFKGGSRGKRLSRDTLHIGKIQQIIGCFFFLKRHTHILFPSSPPPPLLFHNPMDISYHSSSSSVGISTDVAHP
mmetsp:Transcript_16824/g.21860  ORF Transcript_16824/g.21860 Transcript_16824/m.21860 type:complete len:98 (-) Transcript_16824:1658-1951(-)